MKANNRPTYAENALSDGNKLKQWERFKIKIRIKNFWNKYNIAIKQFIVIFVIIIAMLLIMFGASFTN